MKLINYIYAVLLSMINYAWILICVYNVETKVDFIICLGFSFTVTLLILFAWMLKTNNRTSEIPITDNENISNMKEIVANDLEIWTAEDVQYKHKRTKKPKTAVEDEFDKLFKKYGVFDVKD